MEGIDPRLRDAAPQQYEQQQRTPSAYNGAKTESTGYDSLPQPATTAAAGLNQQQHQYYGMPTPGSYSSGGNQENSGSPYDAQGHPNPSDPNDLKRPRACEACRQLKVRCEPDDNSPTGSCRRCAKANRQCVVTAPSRKRQKKTDSRVAELEKKIDALTATLHAQRGSETGDGRLNSAIAQAQMAELEQQRGQLYNEACWQERRDTPSRRETGVLSTPVSQKDSAGLKRKDDNVAQAYDDAGQTPEKQSRESQMPPTIFPNLFTGLPPGPKETTENLYIDVIERQIVDSTTAYRIFERYNKEMQLLPVVVFPPKTNAEVIRRTRPLLFLGILAVACNTIRPDLQATFVREVMKILADRIICRGEKTFEIVQTLQVVTVFYQPPDRYEELNFNQLIHIAVVMATDIGMGKRARKGKVIPWREFAGRNAHPDPAAAETRRTWLGLYFMCANAAMSLRRPLLLRWSAYMDESLDVIAKANDALPSDRWLAHLVRAQRIAEEIGYQFSMDDPPSDVSITQPKIQYQMKTFEKQLDEWRHSHNKGMPQREF
jgi:Fungal Zn(2)-Cys(6) binuclear cluster domain